MQNTIRKVHLWSDDSGTLASTILSLTPDDEGGQNRNIESISWENEGFPPVDVSNFFARSHLSRLCSLDLYGNIQISPWDHLATLTTSLTILSLDITSPPSPTITTSQLFSTLTLNPNLQELSLTTAALSGDVGGWTPKVQLRKLKTLALTGEFHHLFGLLCQFILPETLDDLDLAVFDCTVEDISQTLAPYIQDHFRRDARFHDKLGVSSSAYNSISIQVGVVRTQTTAPVLELPRVSLMALLSQPLPNTLEQLFINLIALTPRERVVSFHANLGVNLPEELFFMMPSIETSPACSCLKDSSSQIRTDHTPT